MTFQTGFAVKQDFPIIGWVTEVAAGVRGAGAVDAPQWAERGMLLEVDDAIGPARRARLPLPSGGYVAGEFAAVNVVDLKAYAAERMTAIRKRQDAAILVDVAAKWIQDKQIFWWKRDAPWQLQDGQRVLATELNEQGLVVADAKGVAQATIPIEDINLNDLDFEESAQEMRERRNTLADHAALPLTSVEEVVALLAKVDVIAPHLPTRPTTAIKLAQSADWFVVHAVKQLRESGLQAADINAFTDRTTDPITILLRPGAQGVGTEVHEMLHALSAEQYRNHSWFFFDEGITEYLTRMATVGHFNRNEKYPAEYDFIDQLVTIGATDGATLARLYFTGDWAGFEATLGTFAGDWVSFPALRTANPATYLAVCDYLKDLHANPEAPLGPAPMF